MREQIKKIAIENFRVFKEKTSFEIRPFTLLTGPNNSGKSSFLKFLNLSQISVKELNSVDVIKFSDVNNDLGNFKNSITWDSGGDYIYLTMDFPLDFFDESFEIELKYRKMGEDGFINGYKIFNANRTLLKINDIVLEYDSNYQSFINEELMYEYSLSYDFEYLKKHIFNLLKQRNLLSPHEKFQDFLFNDFDIRNPDTYELIKLEYDSDPLIKKDLLLLETNLLFQNIPMDNYPKKRINSDLFAQSFLDNDEPFFFWQERNEIPEEVGDKFESDILISRYKKLKEAFDTVKVDEILSASYKDEHINVLRELLIENIENGLNSLKYFLKTIHFISIKRGNISAELENLSKLYLNLRSDIGDDFLIEGFKILDIKGDLLIEKINGRYTDISILNNGRKINISDLGFGYSQVLPILLSIVLYTHLHNSNIAHIADDTIIKSEFFKGLNDKLSPILIIEEPEANLHPNLQSKLADIFYLAYKKLGVRFILETHSEYLIRKLQYLTAKKELKSKDSIIYYFNDDRFVTAKEPKVKEIFINQFGGLSDSFGPGFFDEATRLKFDLIKLQKPQMN